MSSAGPTSAVDADYRIVGDTGSTDDTVERLLEQGRDGAPYRGSARGGSTMPAMP